MQDLQYMNHRNHFQNNRPVHNDLDDDLLLGMNNCDDLLKDEVDIINRERLVLI